MQHHPDFMIIGAMKCATSTLHEQLALQPGIFMTQLKEPNFFSNDEQYALGMDWYWSLFAESSPDDLCGESSTHYTKLPTYPHTLERIKTHCPDARFIYVMRHPIDRLVSQYIHEWTQLVVSTEINQAITTNPELIDYSRYSMQVKPFLETFGSERVLPVFFERLCTHPQDELERVCRFLGYGQPPLWNFDLAAQNASGDRVRKSYWRDFLVDLPVLSTLRRLFIPKGVRTWVRDLWKMKQKPQLTPETVETLKEILDQDLAVLGSWLGVELTCDTYKSVVSDRPLEWVQPWSAKPTGLAEGDRDYSLLP